MKTTKNTSLCSVAVVFAALIGCGSDGASPGGGGNTAGVTSSGGQTGGQAGGHAGSSGSGGKAAMGGTPGTGGDAGGSAGAGVGGTSSGGNAGGGSAGGGNAGTGGSAGAGGGNAGTVGGATGGSAGKAGAGGGGAGGGAGGAGGTPLAVGASGYLAAGSSGQAAPTGAGTTVTVLPWAGFKGAISFNFDDANQTQIDHYKDIQALNDQGNNARFTFYLITGKSNEMKSPVWAQALKDGHELGNHTQSHAQTANTSDMDAAETFIKNNFGVTAYSFAAPYGDGSYVTAAKGKYLTNRTAGDSGGIAFTDDSDTRQYTLPCIIPGPDSSTAAMTSPINQAVTAGKWTTLLIHGFMGGKDGAYNAVQFDNWAAAVKWAKQQGNIWVDTVGNVSAYWIAANKFSKLKPTTSGSDKTWTWKAADFGPLFPAGHYLRVKTDGGTLKQGSTVLKWDDHGYYEVSLDAGTLTLSGQ